MIRLFIPGRPAPGGSKRAFINRHTGKVSLVDAGVGNTDWKARVAHEARLAHSGPPLEGPLQVSFRFFLPRPKGHFYTSRKRQGELKDNAPRYPEGKPDTTKLIRAAEDACKAIIWRDDSQIIEQYAIKIYGSEIGCEIEVCVIDGDEPPPF
jgi:Holliday junction resolvase RusA-like endonuclease